MRGDVGCDEPDSTLRVTEPGSGRAWIRQGLPGLEPILVLLLEPLTLAPTSLPALLEYSLIRGDCLVG